MNFYKKLEDPDIYNFIQKILYLGREPIKKYLLEVIKPQKGEAILDVGCGTGRYAVFSEGYTGIDIDENRIEYGKKRHRGRFLVMDGTHLEFPDESFNYIFSIGVFHHINDVQINKVIGEMKRVCRKGGKVLVIDPVFPSRINFIGYAILKLDQGKHARTFDELNQLLLKHNFKLLTPHIKGGFPSRVPVFCYQKT